ncbi:DUF72 domain-containing protein [Sinorhizobium alkalisoli]|uniref:DUF72 domain-containing protein n=1 Tax=Sinorhizobium alkalisoli TaxID=1752398 RepID=A0A1E3VFL1_9HYPH|nr:DUF72 domain-containing protein [Sinorhizobium alkalisoli]MCA1492270.1 DUF72 domain-containing protein [Ensifer sp. NBAIM29]MCG5481524.1 DUF72 domain-containing protein [Sinorhizobium alkalisoli]ODR92358.1 hypothetical protein A8M32_05475 [Sinorhizobium alkalisoli]
MAETGTIRVGIGGWTFEPWESSFYPSDLPKKRQLEYAGKELRTIEVNGTYYSSQKPATFAKWASEVPDGFIFSLKASRFVTNRKVLSEAGESMQRFLTQGLTELGDRLGPILWQFAATKKFEPDDFEGFLKLLPEKQDGLKLRHVVEVRHPSFQTPDFVQMLDNYKVAAVLAEHADYPMIADVTADFVYARLQKGSDEVETCYPPQALDLWAERLKTFATGREPEGLEKSAPERKAESRPRDVFAFFISSGKVNAPNGARELQKRVD